MEQVFEDLSDESLEVKLVSETTECRSCDWFWRPAPYGPYPAFDFIEDYPPELRERQNQLYSDGEFVRSIKGKTRPENILNPQMLHGCRKSPIMTIGINPNLTGFWSGTKGSRWIYPAFKNYRRYAYYYRHRNVHQESVNLDFIRENLRPDGRLIAEKSGYIARLKRDDVERKITIHLKFEDGTEAKFPQTWDIENHFVMVMDRSWGNSKQFEKGDVLGGFIDLPIDAEIPIEQNVRMIPILERLSSYLRSRGHIPNLEMSEDCAQLNMVACASPGWGDRLKINKKQVIEHCIMQNAWVVKQLIQSRPKVIIFSGRSAFNLFHSVFHQFIDKELYLDMDVYGLMKYTARDPHYLTIKSQAGGAPYELRTRLLISPHFSYDDNFLPHARLSPEEWAEFIYEHGQAAQVLEEEPSRIGEIKGRDKYVPVRLDNMDAFSKTYPRAFISLVRKFYDATGLISDGLAQEVLFGNVTFDKENSHLNRSEGSCNFCVNKAWKFPEGCAYGKPDEPLTEDINLEKVVEDILKSILNQTN